MLIDSLHVLQLYIVGFLGKLTMLQLSILFMKVLVTVLDATFYLFLLS